MLQYQSFNVDQNIQSIDQSKKRKRTLLFDRVQTDETISDFRKYINKNVNIYHIDQHKRTILMFTAQNYHFEVFTYLINNYPKLLLKNDDKDMNIMHYIASSKIDDNQMVELITNKKFSYNKLVWKRDINGNLAKDISKQCNNTQITKSFETIMHDTWSEYHHIARYNNNNNNNNNINNNNNNKNEDSDRCCEDMDMDNNPILNINTQDQAETKQQTISPSKMVDIPYRAITICSRKRCRQSLLQENDDEQNYYGSLASISTNYYSKRRKLNGSGSYLSTTPSQPIVSPSPLPPLPPIQLLTPFDLNTKSYYNTSNTNTIANTSYNMSYDIGSDSTHSPLCQNDNNLPSTFLSLYSGASVLPLKVPKLIRSKAVDMTNNNNNNNNSVTNTNNRYQIIGRNCQSEMEEISYLYYSGEAVTKQQFMFIKWYKKRIGNTQYLPIIIDKGYDDLNKFMTLNKQSCMALFGDGIFNNNQLFGNANGDGDGYQYRYDMNKFNDKMRDLQLSPLSSNTNGECMNQCMRDLSIDNKQDNDNDNVEDEDEDDDIGLNVSEIRNHLISDSVINSSDSISCDDVFGNNNIQKNNVISFPWAQGQCDLSEDDDL